MRKEMEIQTPVLSNVTAAGAKLVVTVPGWVDPEEICGIISGLESIPKVQKKTGGESFSGAQMTVLVTRGGQKILAMGQPEAVRVRVKQALGMKSAPAEQEASE